MFYNSPDETCNFDRDEDGYNGPRNEKKPRPVTPRMLVKALKSLKKKTFKGLFFSPRDVAREIINKLPCVEQDFPVLLLEVSDKLTCAAAAGLIGSKHDLGYYAFDFRQNGHRSHSRSELMFWVFYKRILNQKMEYERRKRGGCRRASISGTRRKVKIPEEKPPKYKACKRENIYHVLPLY